MGKRSWAFVFVAAVAAQSACASVDPLLGGAADEHRFERWKSTVQRERGPRGAFIVDGDIAIPDEKRLRVYFQREVAGQRLSVMRVGDADDVWGAAQKRDLRYCIGNTFGPFKARVVEAMAAAGSSWEGAADVKFAYVPDEDAACTADNPRVVFDVNGTSGEGYLARAFFPSYPRADRNVLIDESSFYVEAPLSLAGILRHELGHTLGFRHEHTRPESGTCYEDANWRPLTPYDSASVMHYPQCNGTGDWSLTLTAYDIQGAQGLYNGSGTPPPPMPPSEERTLHFTGAVAQNEEQHQGPFAVVAGTSFVANMTGDGDADLYVAFGARPTVDSWVCRPYSDQSAEDCRVTVPADATQAFVMVRGFAAGTNHYALDVTYRTPAAPATGLVANGSFEQGEPPTDWTAVGAGQLQALTDGSAADQQRHARFVSLSTSYREAVSRCFALPNKAGLRVRAMARTPNARERTRASLRVYYFTGADCTTPATTASQSQSAVTLAASGTWQTIDFSRRAADLPADATYAAVAVRARYVSGVGASTDEVHFDAVVAEEVPATLENGSFEADEGAPPQGWSLLTPGTFRAESGTVAAQDGARVARFGSLTSSISGREARTGCLRLSLGKALVASAFFRTPQAVGRTRAALRIAYFTDEGCTTPAARASDTQTPFALGAQDAWERHELARTAEEVPSDARYAFHSVRARYVSGVGASTDVVYFDSFAMEN